MSDCIESQYKPQPDGYPRKRVGKRRHSHARAVYMEAFGPVPDGMDIDHLCRNRACINLDHLEMVTHAENMRRSAGYAKNVGSSNGKSKLNEVAVAVIRHLHAEGRSVKDLSSAYGVSSPTISQVVNYRSWVS